MGSTIYDRRNMQLYILMTIVVFLLFGCPNPNMHVWFFYDQKLVKELKMNIIDNSVKLIFNSFSSVGSPNTKYNLRIKAEVVFTENMKKDFILRPNLVRAFVGDHIMEVGSNYFTPYEDTLSKGKYVVDLDFSYNINSDSQIVASIYSRKGFEIKIAVDSFVLYRGEPVHIDTLRAIEKQGFLY
ncbi:hypothetical protein TRIP_C60003 [Candidatus Zixiibacteriota bacterium]|nr:hypothetical protein TRIP_C60003 [candidate division Zixibacteria bacterium]